jgi:hypothetical protein
MAGSIPLPGNLPSQVAFPPATVANRIRECVEAGQGLLHARADGPAAFASFRANRSKWDDQNREMLRRLFKTDLVRAAYDKAGPVPPGAATPAIELERLRDSVSDKLALLHAILDRLEGLGDGAGDGRGAAGGTDVPVLVIHVDEPALARAVARVLEGLKYTPVLVSNHPHDGEIAIDRLDAYRDARFAVVLIAGDQVPGYAERIPHAETVVRLGYVIGRLGSGRVCALHQPGLALPGKALGLRGIEYDEAGAWKATLAQRLDGV